ncbi:MAG: flagellar hook basal-body protein [Spartobacteria bacterium]|nr:flagellar hook basal-body protein [Spartobacteria bacterium]
MESGFYSPAFRMIKGLVDRLDAVSENLANANNPGYRRLNVTGKVFDAVLGDYMAGESKHWTNGLKYDPVSVDFTEGAFQQTDRSMDFAINGKGFFVVRNEDDKLFYTRNGHFRLDPEQRLINADGFLVEGQNGEIILPDPSNLNSLRVGRDGTLVINDRRIDQLTLAHFEDLQKLNRVGTTLFTPAQGQEPMELPETTTVVNGMLERSNSHVVEEMTELITITRAYEACQRMLKAEDEREGKMIQSLGSK